MNNKSKNIHAGDLSDIAKDPGRWFLKARALERCADLLWESFKEAFTTAGHAEETPDYLETAYLLYGLCLEVAFKGLIISEHPQYVAFGGTNVNDIVSFPGVGSGGHDLIDLATKAGFSEASAGQMKDDFEQLTQCITWLSRYPAPKKVGSNGKNTRFNLGLRDRIKPAIAKVLHDTE